MGLIDPDHARAASRLEAKRNAGVIGYEETKIFPSIEAASEGLKGDDIPL